MYGPAKVDYRVEGFLFPSTYEIPVGSTPEEILKRMAGEMNKQLTPEIRAQIEAKHMTIFRIHHLGLFGRKKKHSLMKIVRLLRPYSLNVCKSVCPAILCQHSVYFRLP